MGLNPIKDSDLDLITPWLANKENYQWLDFGRGVQKLEAPILKVMLQRDIHDIRLFTPDGSDKPIGLVAFSEIHKTFKSAILWYMLGDKSFSGKRYTTLAVSDMIKAGFDNLELKSIMAWTLKENIASRKVLKKNNFSYIGKWRNCHYIDNKPYDRLYYDLIPEDFSYKQ